MQAGRAYKIRGASAGVWAGAPLARTPRRMSLKRPDVLLVYGNPDKMSEAQRCGNTAAPLTIQHRAGGGTSWLSGSLANPNYGARRRNACSTSASRSSRLGTNATSPATSTSSATNTQAQSKWASQRNQAIDFAQFRLDKRSR